MKKIVAVVNQKGGVGKSTTAQALGAGLGRKGWRVLMVDMDQQGNLSYAMGADTQQPGCGEVLLGTHAAMEAIQHIPQGDVIASSTGLAGADMVITQTGKEYRLREALEPLHASYDYIILDTPPAMGILSVNALTAATDAIVPVQADIFSLQGVGQLLGTYQAVRKYTNPGISVMGLLLTRFSERSVLSRTVQEMARETAEAFGSVVFDTAIRDAVAIREAQISRCNIFDYAPKSNVAKDYEAFVKEVLARG